MFQRNYFFYYVICILCFCGLKSHAQLTVTPSISAYQMATIIAGPGVTVFNASYVGMPIASGSFSSTGTVLGLNSGIVLTTGEAVQSIGPNNDDASSTAFNSIGDSDLESLTGIQTFDAAVLEFDFIPQSDTLTFRYVFASEEYPEYVCSEFNDLFGFFISGPGIVGKSNLALIPGTTSPVAINTINNGSIGTSINGPPSTNCGLANAAFYIDNTGGIDIQYDGLTTIFTAEKFVTKCLTYHLKIAIADGADSALNSGVFIEAGSLSSTPIVTAGIDLNACVNLNSFIGGASTIGWNYTWNPSLGLNNAAISNPSIILTNNTTLPVSYNYVVTADNGTTCILHDTVVVTINPFPTSPFSVSTLSICQGDTVNINYSGNTLTGNYNWNFTGGIIILGTGVGPYKIAYPNSGNYPIALSVSNSTCISAASNQVVHVKAAPNSTFLIPSTVCSNDIFNASYIGNYISTTANYSWNFGSSTILSGSGKGPYQLNAIGSGISNYSLTVSDSGCTTSSIKPITINALPVASISAIPDFCTGDTITINYTGTGSAISIYNWDLGNGHLISGSGGGPYQIFWSNQFSDSVKVIVNDNGCIDTAFTLFHSYQQPIAALSFTPSICELAKIAVTFNGSAAAGSVYTWMLNNPFSQQGSGAGPIVANWNSPGKKAISLTINNHGCTSSVIDTLTVLPNPIASITSVSKLCTNDSLVISSTSIASTNAIYNWNFGNAQSLFGFGQGPYNLKWNTQRRDSIQLIINDNGCRDTAFKIVDVYQQPVAIINTPFALCEKEKGSISFVGSAFTGTVFNWSFSNPSSQIGAGPYLTSWNNAGIKTIRLSLNNNGCIDTISAKIKINPNPISQFTADGVCNGFPVMFHDTSSILGSTITNNSWNFGDAQSTTNIPNPIHYYAKDSTYNAELIVQSIEGCKDTISKLITIYAKPIAQFYSDTVCQGTATTLNDLSTVINSTINKWKWMTGDGDSINLKNPNHIYSAAGIFTTSLVVTTLHGCADTIIHPTRVWYLPTTSFIPISTSGCQPLLVNFNNTSISVDGSITFIQWKFGDGDGDSINNPSHLYNSSGNYTVSLFATTNLGCKNDTVINNCVTVFPKPEASFYYTPTEPDMLFPKMFFINTSTYNTINKWIFSDGATSIVESPDHTYKNSGIYPVTLYVTSDDGCKDTSEQIITIKNVFTIYIPNAFTPNNDILNDQFIVLGYGITSYAINIFDRWGKLIFSSDSMINSWDGTINGKEAPEDTYVYQINIRDFTTMKHEYVGRVSIIR